MAKKLTAKGGPLNGKTFLVPDTVKHFTHPAADNGHYRVHTKTATWQPNKPEATDTTG